LLECTVYGTLLGWVKKPKSSPANKDTQSHALERQGKRVPAIFFRTEAGGEPLRDWSATTGGPQAHRRGHQDSGVRLAHRDAGLQVTSLSLGDGIYEVRTNLKQNRIAQVLFYIDKMGRMVLLHGFIRKTQKTPDENLELARNNQRKHKRGPP
jgi:hypothetical protein